MSNLVSGFTPENQAQADLIPIFSKSDYTDLIKGHENIYGKGADSGINNTVQDWINSGLESLGKGVGSSIDTKNAGVNVSFDYKTLIIPAALVLGLYFIFKG